MNAEIRRIVRVGALVLPLVALSGGAQAAERVMVILQELVDGAPAGSSVGEVRLSEQLLGAGFSVVEAVETEAARQRISVEKLLGGAVGGEVTALNADTLIVGRISASSEEIPYGVTDYSAAVADWAVRAIAVDSGRVLASKTGEINATGRNARAANAAARKQSAEAIFKAMGDVLGKPGAAGGTIGLAISGLQELEQVEEVKKVLSGTPGVNGVEVRLVSGNETRIDVRVEKTDTWAFASALKARSEGRLVVSRLSRSVVHARWVPHGAGRRILVAAFRNETGLSQHDWLSPLLPEVFETELSNSRYLQPAETDKRVVLDKAEPSPGEVKSLLKKNDADLLCAGRIELAGDAYRLVLAVYEGKRGKKVTAAEVFGQDSELLDRTKELVWALDEKLYAKLFEKEGLGTYERVIAPANAAAAGGQRGARLAISDVSLGNIYPAQLPVYAERPFGKIVLSNPGSSTVGGVRVKVNIPLVMSAPTILRADDLGPGASREVPLTVLLDQKKLMSIGENSPTRAELAVVYLDGREEVSDVFTQPVVVFDKNAINWSNPESIASFVTHKDPAVSGFADGVVAAGRKAATKGGTTRESELVPMMLFEALGALPVRYRSDAENPFGGAQLDSVLFPGETLARGAGDCDDLSVLYAALLKSQGVRAAFVLTPGHILVAMDTGVAATNAGRLGLPEGTVVERSGNAWLPVEVTALQGTFADAVLAGAAELKRYGAMSDGVSFIDVSEAWKRYPPFPGPYATDRPVAVPTRTLEKRIAAAVERRNVLVGTANLPAPAALEDAGELNRLGVQLGNQGRWQDAEAYLLRAADKSPDRKEYAYNLANVRVLSGKLDAAGETYERLSRGKELKAPSLYGLGIVRYLQGDGKSAGKLLRRSGLAQGRAALRRLGLVVKRRASARKPRGRAGASRPDPSNPLQGVRASAERVSKEDLLIWLR